MCVCCSVLVFVFMFVGMSLVVINGRPLFRHVKVLHAIEQTLKMSVLRDEHAHTHPMALEMLSTCQFLYGWLVHKIYISFLFLYHTILFSLYLVFFQGNR